MPRADYRCPECQNVEERSFYLWDKIAPFQMCGKCLVEMERLPSAPNFAIKGFSEKNGYSK